MSLRFSPPSSAGIRAISWNQDNTCVCVADGKGVKIFSLDTHKVCYQQDIGAVSVAEMLFCTSLLAFVGAGEQPALTPRKLTLLNTSNQSVIKELSFTTTVLAVRMNRQRLVAVLRDRVYVYNLQTLAQLHVIDTPHNPKGVAALGSCSEPCLLALPAAGGEGGAVRVYDLAGGCRVLAQVDAHKSPVVCMAWNADCSLLATASGKGTVVRVHALPAASKAFTFRRGSTPTAISALAFSPPGVQPPLLAAASEHGTVHVFRLADPERHPAASAATGLLAAVLPPRLSDALEPQRTLAALRLPCGRGVAATLAVLGPFTRADAAFADEDAGVSGSGRVGEGGGHGGGGGGDAVMIAVATGEGICYEFWLSGYGAHGTPRCSLEGETYLCHPGHGYEPE